MGTMDASVQGVNQLHDVTEAVKAWHSDTGCWSTSGVWDKVHSSIKVCSELQCSSVSVCNKSDEGAAAHWHWLQTLVSAVFFKVDLIPHRDLYHFLCSWINCITWLLDNIFYKLVLLELHRMLLMDNIKAKWWMFTSSCDQKPLSAPTPSWPATPPSFSLSNNDS